MDTNTFDPDLEALARRQRLAQMLMVQGGETSPILSPWQGMARVVQSVLGNMQSKEADDQSRALVTQRTAQRQAEMGHIFDTAQGGDKMALAKLLAQSNDPTFQQAGLGMVMKGPGKLEFHDAGDHWEVTDEAGHTVRTIPKSVTPDAVYGKTTVGADTKFTQGAEDQRQQRGFSTIPATATYTQGQENARQWRSLVQNEKQFQEGQDKPQIVQGPNGEVLTVRPASGTGAPVLGADGQPLTKGDKPLSEVQGNAAAFGMRAKAANDIINDLESHGAPLGSVTGMLANNRATNVVAPEWAQKAAQAKLNFMSATLRKESGAAINASEYDAEDKKYFPQPGDSAAVIDQKRSMRDLAIKTLKVQAGQQGAKQIDAGISNQTLRFDAQGNLIP